MTKKHSDEAQDIALIRAMTVRTDPSVHCEDLVRKGEPMGCVPIERTMQRPKAYRPPRSRED